MDRLGDEQREALLLRLLDDIDNGVLRSNRFGAAEVRTMGSVALIVFNHEGGGAQPNYQGFMENDLWALATAGLVEVSQHGKSLDVIVLPAASRYRGDLNAPGWKRGARKLAPLTTFVKYGAAIIAGALLNQIASALIWPWLSGLLGVSR